MSWLTKLKTKLRGERYIYGRCHRHDVGQSISPCRFDKVTGKIELILWRAGEYGHLKDVWHPVGEGWEIHFIPDRESSFKDLKKRKAQLKKASSR